MKKEALPYYRWYWKDYRADRKVQQLDYVGRGLYRELLDECWAEGFIPNNLDRLAEICGCPKQTLGDRWRLLSVCFTEIQPGILVNNRMNAERTEKDAHRVKCSLSGRYGGLAKQHAGKQEANASERQANSSERHIELALALAIEEQEQEKFATLDGSLAFENSMALYHADKRDYSNLAQKCYFEAIGEIRQIHGCTSSEAVARLDKHITAYVASKREFCMAFLKYMDSKPWKAAVKAAPVRDKAKEQAELQALEDKLKRENRERRARERAAVNA